jgi:hypothetical protein
MKEAQTKLATIEDNLYDSPDEAEKAGKKYSTSATDWIKKKVMADADHTGAPPKKGEGYPPIGTMADAR